MWPSEAPASNAPCVDSICSEVVIGTAGLSRLRGTEPVIATAMTTGLMVCSCAVANRRLPGCEPERTSPCPIPGFGAAAGFPEREHSRRLLLVGQNIPQDRARPANFVPGGSGPRSFWPVRSREKPMSIAAESLPISAPSAAADTRRRIIAIVGASSGNLVEWYDFYAYSFTALYFASAFFPSGDRTTQLLNTAGVFAAGFFMRPLGGWLFGWIADTHGRRTSMIISVLMMCAGSLMIAVMPTYASIGAVAPALLLLARLVQGLSVGGEYGTSATYMSEVAAKGHRGFYASFQYVMLIGLQQFLSADELKAWGWRVPFLVGAIAAVVALFLRRSLAETASEESMHSKEAGTLRGLLHHKRAVLLVLGFTAGGSLIFYTFTTYMQKYLVNTAGMDAKTASTLMTL